MLGCMKTELSLKAMDLSQTEDLKKKIYIYIYMWVCGCVCVCVVFNSSNYELLRESVLNQGGVFNEMFHQFL